MKIPFLSFLLLTIGPFAFASQEINQAEKTFSSFHLPLPISTQADFEQIEQELTPAKSGQSVRTVSIKKQVGCTKEIVRIGYRLDENSPIEYFEAEIVHPVGYVRWQKSRVPGVVIQPTLAGPGIVERKTADSLCRANISSIRPVENPKNLHRAQPDPDFYDRFMRAEILRARRMLDVLRSHAKVDPDRMGAIGFSRGAIVTSLLISLEPNIKYAYMGAGGMGIADISADSAAEVISDERDALMTAMNLSSTEDYRNLMRKTLRYEPLLFAHRIQPENVALMLVNDDDSVLSNYQERMRMAFRGPDTLHLNHGHIGSILWQIYLRDRDFLSFFTEKFDLSTGFESCVRSLFSKNLL